MSECDVERNAQFDQMIWRVGRSWRLNWEEYLTRLIGRQNSKKNLLGCDCEGEATFLNWISMQNVLIKADKSHKWMHEIFFAIFQTQRSTSSPVSLPQHFQFGSNNFFMLPIISFYIFPFISLDSLNLPNVYKLLFSPWWGSVACKKKTLCTKLLLVLEYTRVGFIALVVYYQFVIDSSLFVKCNTICTLIFYVDIFLYRLSGAII